MFPRRLISGMAVAALLSSAGVFSANAQSATAAPEPQIQNFGTWSTRCDESQTGAKRCHAFVNVATGEQKKSLLYLAIGYGPQDSDGDGDNELYLFAMTPLGTFLPSGIGWSVDGKEGFSQQFMFCIAGGCQTEILLSEERLKSMKTGNQMDVVFRLVGQGDVKVPVKLDGITKAIAAIPVPKKS
ncbi:invasion associated locus B family protein [uncultured Parvibaculum sp.]|uniref:invasion associated locus B family protein n=1 Tax=uncultured Parvibaculum sp. TaxID=291828 RepID=UPI0030D7EF2F|tara:strand:+ start:48155 stop:48709 length:555 start_codon:yes stop_codon:yes gene_type:complete